MIYSLALDFKNVDYIVLQRLGKSIISFTLREALSLYYGLIVENKSEDDRRAFDMSLLGEKFQSDIALQLQGDI